MALSSLTFVSSVAHSFVVKQTVCVIWIFLSYVEYSSRTLQQFYLGTWQKERYCNIMSYAIGNTCLI